MKKYSKTGRETKIKPKNINKESRKSNLIVDNKIVITAALPYANGSIHIGHLLEYIQADIYSRFLKSTGKDALYICASDQHGTPIEINAKKAGTTPQKFVEKYWKEHQADFKSFLIDFDNYWQTHSTENKELSEWFFSELKKKGHIYTKSISAIYCESCTRFLPDRFVKGECPHCQTQDQYGDVCENCSSILKGSDLLKPYCTICKNTPIQKDSTHYFFKLSAFNDKLATWLKSEKSIQPEIKNLLKCWLDKGLEDWCISRDGPYFGFEIPGSKEETGETKYFYVWLDAPIGYIASTKNYCDANNLDWKDYWFKGKVQHFIGKDIVYFHYLFWVAQFIALDIPTPTLTTHGFITVNGKKMSKSRGTFFTGKQFLEHFNAESLRFFYASHLDRKLVDVDLNFEEFKAVNNNCFLGALGNFCYRTLAFAQKNYGNIKAVAKEAKLEKEITQLFTKVHESYTNQDFKTAVQNILKIATLGNQYFQEAKPWKNKEQSEDKVGFCVNLARNLAIVVSPILPEFSEKIFSALKEDKTSWNDLSFEWKGEVTSCKKLVEKIDTLPEKKEEEKTFPANFKVAKIIEAKNHPESQKLMVFKLDCGEEKPRQIVSGIQKFYTPDQLEDKKVMIVANLKKAKLAGEVSQGMIISAFTKEDTPDEELKVVILPDTAKVGEQITCGNLKSNESQINIKEFFKLTMKTKKGAILVENYDTALQLEGKNIAIKAPDGWKVG